MSQLSLLSLKETGRADHPRRVPSRRSRAGKRWARQPTMLVLLLASGCSRSESTAQKTQLDGAKAALEAAHVADVAARTKQLAECSAEFMIWPKYGHIYERCPSDSRPSFIDEWRPARPPELEAFKAAGGVPVQDWEGRATLPEDTTASPLFYTPLMCAFAGSAPQVWAIFQSSDESSSHKRCNHSRELLVKDGETLPLVARAAFYCLPTTGNTAR